MLDVMIFSALFGIIQKLWIMQLQRSLKQSTDLEESITLRVKIKRRRVSAFIVLLLLYTVYVAWGWKDVSLVNLITSPYGSGIVSGGVICLLYFIAYLMDSPVGNISTLTKNLFLKKYSHGYVLYLRGFSVDDYAPKSVLEMRKKGVCFSEYKFVEAVAKSLSLSICAVGMTKEVDAPHGAIRVYVDDATWKSDVYELMEKATHIFILVNDRKSCIWEIKQTNGMLDKTTLIVDDPIKYSVAQRMMTGMIKLPNVESGQDRSLGVVTFRDGEAVVNIVPNTKRGYTLIAKASLPKRGWVFYVVAGIARLLVVIRWLVIISLVAITIRFIILFFQ